MDDATTAQLGAQVGGWAAGLVGALLVISSLLTAAKKLPDGWFGLLGSWLSGARRVATERQEGIAEAQQREIDGLGKAVDRLRTRADKLEQQVEEIRWRYSEMTAYAWRAYDRVLKHEPNTDLPSPREHMATLTATLPAPAPDDEETP